MLASIDHRTLKVLTPTLAQRLQVFNQAARELQFRRIRLLSINPEQNGLTIDADAAERLLATQQLQNHRQIRNAGSTRHSALFRGVTLNWRTPITSTRPEDWAPNTLH